MDTLLQDERIRPDGITGATAGAVNTVARPHGLVLAATREDEAANPRGATRTCLRTIDVTNRMLTVGRLAEGVKYKHMRLHRIDRGKALENLPTSSKMSTDSAMIEKLFDMGKVPQNAGCNAILTPWASTAR